MVWLKIALSVMFSLSKPGLQPGENKIFSGCSRGFARIREQIITYPQDDGFILSRKLAVNQPAQPVRAADSIPLHWLSPDEILSAISRWETQIFHDGRDHKRRRDLEIEG